MTVADFSREASRVRRDEIRRKVDGSVGKIREGNTVLSDIRGLVDDADALDAALVAADREVARLTDESAVLRARVTDMATQISRYAEKVAGPRERSNMIHLRERNIDAAHLRWIANSLRAAVEAASGVGENEEEKGQ